MINLTTGNYCWADGMQATFFACACNAGVKDPKGYGSDFAAFWNKHHNNTHPYDVYVHPTEMRKVIHWFFEKSELDYKLKLSTSTKFLNRFYDIVETMLKSNKNKIH
jgi:hypothetical protein